MALVDRFEMIEQSVLVKKKSAKAEDFTASGNAGNGINAARG